MTPRTRPPRRAGPGKGRATRRKRSKLGLLCGLAVVVLIGAYAAVLVNSRPKVAGDRLRLDSFIDLAERGHITDARILDQDSFVVGHYVADTDPHTSAAPTGAAAFGGHGLGATPSPATTPVQGPTRVYNVPYLKTLDSRTGLLTILLDNRVPTTIDQQFTKSLLTPATVLLPALVLVVLFIYLILSYRKGSGLFGITSGAKRIRASDAGNVTFDDVAGQTAAVTELREISDFLAAPERFAAVGAQVPKGVLLYGPPGCGKTLLAKALASEAGASFFSISGSDFVEVYVGVGASRVRDLFKEARAAAPSLIFIDELDSLGRARGAGAGTPSHGEQEQALNQLLAEMDGFSTSEGILVLGATNRPDILDQALLRPGRFDRTIGLERPDEASRLAILRVHVKDKPLAPGVDLEVIARRAIGLTGADLAGVVNEAALLAGRAGRPAVGQADLDGALQRILAAPERQRRLSLRERSIGTRFTGDDRITFADVAGQDAAIAQLRPIKDFLTDPDRFAAVGAVAPKGVLLFGPPGCGKTMLARALACEANAAFFSMTASEFDQVMVGTGAARVREVFAEARSMAPAIIFIDELDSIGRTRTAADRGRSEQDQSLTQLLAEMDGFARTTGVTVLGATNRPDALDPALLRPGRFDRTIGLGLPDEAARLAILAIHARSKRVEAGVDLAAVAKAAIGLTGADLASVLNEGALRAAQDARPAIAPADVDAALRHILAAPGEQRRLSMRGRSVAARSVTDERVTFADVAGVDGAVTELADVRDFLADPARFARIGARVPRGILLSGPPGCGKTLLARAVAGEANAAFFSVAGSQFVEMFVGVGASRVRELFAEARAMAPAIVFIDEIDSVGGHRSASPTGGEREVEQTLNQLLVELDGFEPGAAVVVMAATNRPDRLDPALVRPGRFDRTVTISPPDRDGRLAILDLHARRRRLAPDVNLGVVAGLTRGFSGADLENVLNEAALLGARAGIEVIPMALVEEGVDRATLGVRSRGTIMTEAERRVVAYHEAGHALVGLALPGATPPHKLTISPRGGTLGRCTLIEDRDQVLASRSALIDRMATYLGGWAAERLVFGEAGSGVASDLEAAGGIARRMVRDYGMSEALGPLAAPLTAPAGGGDAPAYSEEESRIIYAEARVLLGEATARAEAVLVGARDHLDAVAVALLDAETLTAADVARIAPRPQMRARAPKVGVALPKVSRLMDRGRQADA